MIPKVRAIKVMCDERMTIYSNTMAVLFVLSVGNTYIKWFNGQSVDVFMFKNIWLKNGEFEYLEC